MQYLTLGKATDFHKGRMRAFRIGDDELAIALVDGRFYAFSNFCTHQREYLTDGFIIDRQVICALHEATYDLETGAILYGPAFEPLQTFPVRAEGGEIQLGWPDETPIDQAVPVDHQGEERPARDI